MKNNLLLIAAITLFGLSSCKKKSEDAAPSTNDQLTAALTAGSWNVSSAMIQATDHTIDFKDFAFNFNKNNSVAAANPFITENGNWAVVSHNNTAAMTYNFPNSNSIEMFIEMSGGYWDIVSHSETRIEMQRMTTENQMDHLVIQRQ